MDKEGLWTWQAQANPILQLCLHRCMCIEAGSC